MTDTDIKLWMENIQRRLDELDSRTRGLIRMGPRPETERDAKHRDDAAIQRIVDGAKKILDDVKPTPQVDRSARVLASGAPVPADDSHTELKENGQQKDYVVLSAEERAKGFVRPVRYSYRHIGLPAITNPLRDLTPEEAERHRQWNYVKFEVYPESESPKTGRFWTQEQLDSVNKGCGVVTRMSTEIPETYARDPGFYGGTMCVGCGVHLPLEEFVWDGTNERVGS